jgi:hypothetical protein
VGKAAKSEIAENVDMSLWEEIAPHSLQRKAAIAWGKGTDHSGNVRVVPMDNFDMDRTIFSTLEGKLPRIVMEAKIANVVYWDDHAAGKIEEAYRDEMSDFKVPEIDPKLIHFIMSECDFDMEHADGSFLEHLLFCHEYSARHYPEYSANILFLHSILGTATNTFAMEAHKIPMLRELLTDFEARHIEAFPSIFRLIYDLSLLKFLNANVSRLSDIKSITFHRVIDNEKMTLSAEDLWIALNFQMIHFVDFLPAANWVSHRADPLIQFFQDVYDFLERAGKRQAKVDFNLMSGSSDPVGEERTLGGKFSALIPPIVKRKLAAKSVRQFSDKIGHSLDYQIEWK